RAVASMAPAALLRHSSPSASTPASAAIPAASCSTDVTRRLGSLTSGPSMRDACSATRTGRWNAIVAVWALSAPQLADGGGGAGGGAAANNGRGTPLRRPPAGAWLIAWYW